MVMYKVAYVGGTDAVSVPYIHEVWRSNVGTKIEEEIMVRIDMVSIRVWYQNTGWQLMVSYFLFKRRLIPITA